MTQLSNNKLAGCSLVRLLSAVREAEDKAEQADNRADHSFYRALTLALTELQERRSAAEAREPVAYMIGGHYLMHAQDPKVDNYASAVPLYAAPQPVAAPELTVWYGPMPESNGKTNWTASLHRKGDPVKGFTIDRSEYPDRVRYEADRMRWLIGELPEEPDILEYDENKHSGYVSPKSQPVAVPDDDKTNMLCDSAYVNGLQAGFSMGQMNQEAEYAQTVEHYRKGIREYRAAMLNAEPVSQPYKLPSELLAAMEEVLRISDRDHEAWHRARDGIAAYRAAHQPSSGALQLPQWIPCSERMPEETGRYWCYVEEQNDLGKSHYQWNCSWNGNRWWVESENGGRVTHWQPLPSAPQEPTI